MIYPVLSTEEIVAVGDKTRLDATASYLSGTSDSITKVEIQAESAGTWYDVTADKYLDWAYATDGDKVPSVRVTSTTAGPTAVVGAISVLTVAADLLYSSDQKLKAHENGILKYLPEGRATFKHQHRRAQTLMLDWLAREGYTDRLNERLTKSALVVNEDVEGWATFMCLRLIMEDASNAIDDVFSEKAKRYKGLEVEARTRATLRLDLDGDGDSDPNQVESVKTAGAVVLRR